MTELLSDSSGRALPDLSLVVRRDGVIVANLGGRELGMAHGAGQLHGTTLRALWTPEIATQLQDLVRRALKTRTCLDQRYQYQNRRFEVSVRPQGVERALMAVRALPQLPSAPLPPTAMPEEDGTSPVLESREAFERRLAVAVANALLRESTLAVAVIHLGGLREVEDAVGPACGARLMAAALDRLRMPPPTLSRATQRQIAATLYSNDVLAVLLDQIPGGDAVAVEMERIRRTLSEPLVYEERGFHLRPTIGVARFPEHGTQPQPLFDKAQAAMSEALCAQQDAAGSGRDPSSTDEAAVNDQD